MKSLRTSWHKIKAQMLKEPLPPEGVAAGWALGVFIGFAVPFGLQLIVSIPLAMMMRVSKIGATVGTFVTNPATIFFVYPAQTWAMYNLLFGRRGLGSLPEEWTLQAVAKLSGPVIISFFLGGLVLALVLSPAVYFAVKRIVIRTRSKWQRKNSI